MAPRPAPIAAPVTCLSPAPPLAGTRTTAAMAAPTSINLRIIIPESPLSFAKFSLDKGRENGNGLGSKLGRLRYLPAATQPPHPRIEIRH
jgi:hypothetical protein